MTISLDHSALRVNQAGIIATVLAAVVGSAFAWPVAGLIPVLAVILLIGTWRPELALFKQLYLRVLKPHRLVGPRLLEDDPRPHNFAQGLGGIFLAVASGLLVVAPIAGLALALLVAALAAVNLFFGYCLGCQIYFQLGRRGLVGAP